MDEEFSLDIRDKKLIFNTGYLGRQADGAVAVSYGEAVVFASAVVSKKTKEGQDYFPLMIDYREKAYAAGNIPGGFIKRASRPSDKEVLISRCPDRPLRPLFPKGFLNEVQVIIYVLSADQETQQDIVAINAASAALMISGAPFSGPVGAVRVGRVNNEWIVNPDFSQSKDSDIDIIVAGKKEGVTMIEGSSKGVSESDMVEAVEFAHEYIKKICAVQEKLAEKYAKPLMEYKPVLSDEKLQEEIRKRYFTDIENIKKYETKKERDDLVASVIDKAIEELEEQYPDTIVQAGNIIHDLDGEILRKRILEENIRADGRGLKDIRPIDIMVGILPRTHGSAVFTRGETQSLGITTLGSSSDAQRVDSIEGKSEKSFMLHYQFPPFSVGETGRHGGVGRREIGHGILAERALQYVIPDEVEFPYTIRQVSEILESNGSSSMASVCSGSLSMFNAGVPLKDAVAGIAMGLIMEGDKYAVLSDITGLEDHSGDMDFKVAGTSEGITAFQMDIKIKGITAEIISMALEQAKEGRLHILSKMNEVIKEPEKALSPYAPKIKVISVDQSQIGEVIGPGGKIIRRIIEETGAEISIDDDGMVAISAVSQDSIDAAVKYVLRITEGVKVNEMYDGVVKGIVDFGAFVEVAPGKEGLIHISKLDNKHVTNVSDILEIGQKVRVKVLKVDNRGRIDLSLKDAI